MPVYAVDGATTTTGPGARRDLQHPIGRLEMQRSHHDGLGGPVRTRNLTARAAWRSAAAPARDRGTGSPISARTAARCRRPARQDRAVSARIMASRSRPRTPVPGASPLPIGGRPFDGRYSGCGQSSTHGIPSSSAAMPPPAVMTSDTTRSGASSRSVGTLSTAIRAARRCIRAPASSVLVGGHQPVQLDARSIPARAGGFEPFHAGEQRGRVAGLGEALAQRNRRKRVPGIRPGDHGDAHRHHPATAPDDSARLRWQP